MTYKNFVLDLIPLIKENLEDVKNQQDNDYNSGKVFAYYDVLSLIQQQAIAFGIDPKELKLDYQLENELIYTKADTN